MISGLPGALGSSIKVYYKICNKTCCVLIDIKKERDRDRKKIGSNQGAKPGKKKEFCVHWKFSYKNRVNCVQFVYKQSIQFDQSAKSTYRMDFEQQMIVTSQLDLIHLPCCMP
jgi:hypothetical protein